MSRVEEVDWRTIIPGVRYEVIYVPAGAKLPRRMVGQYLGRNMSGLDFSLRPIFGTTSIPPQQLRKITQTVEPISAPKIYRGNL